MLPNTHNRNATFLVDLEAEDIISAFKMNFNLGNVQKVLCRLGTKAGTTDKYDLQKILWMTLKEMEDRDIISKQQLWEYRKLLGLSKEV